MRMGRFWPGLILAAVFVVEVHASGPSSARSQGRIRNKEYGVSVIFPRGWYVWEGAGLPIFFNYSAVDAPPQGRLPPHGASIAVTACQPAPYVQHTDDVSSCADQAASSCGVAKQQSQISGPITAAPALRIDCDEPALGRGGDTVRLVVLFWQFRGRAFGAQLEYIKGDSNGPRYERTLLDVVNSFRPL